MTEEKYQPTPAEIQRVKEEMINGQTRKTAETEPSIKIAIEYVGSTGKSNIGEVDCIDEGNSFWRLSTLRLDGLVPKEEVLQIAIRFGIKEQLVRELDRFGIWDSQFTLVLNCNFSDISNSPRVLGATLHGEPAPVEFSDHLFGNWRPSGDVKIVIDKSATPAKVKFIIN